MRFQTQTHQRQNEVSGCEDAEKPAWENLENLECFPVTSGKQKNAELDAAALFVHDKFILGDLGRCFPEIPGKHEIFEKSITLPISVGKKKKKKIRNPRKKDFPMMY